MGILAPFVSAYHAIRAGITWLVAWSLDNPALASVVVQIIGNALSALSALDWRFQAAGNGLLALAGVVLLLLSRSRT